MLLLLAGPVTAIPLLLFAAAAQRLPMVTLGLLFYLNPGLQMAWGVLVGHEPMPVGRWLGFALIWVGWRCSPAMRCFAPGATHNSHRQLSKKVCDCRAPIPPSR